MTLATFPFFISLITQPVTLSAYDQICIIISSADWEWPYELVVNIKNHNALFLNSGTVLIASANENDKPSWFSGTVAEMRREYCE